MINAVAVLLLCQLAGELLVRASGLPVPGPVLGLVLLAALLLARGGAGPTLGATASTLLGNLSLLFVPAGVGIVQHLGRLQTEGVAIAAALVGSTLLSIAVTALVFAALARRAGPGEEEPR